MKSLLKSIAITAVGFYLLTLAIPGFQVAGGIRTFLIGSAVLTILNWTVRPIANLLLLPINLLTLGMFRWVVNVFTLWLVSVFVADFSIVPFAFPGYSSYGFTLPPLTLNVFWTTTLGAFFLSLSTELLNWLVNAS